MPPACPTPANMCSERCLAGTIGHAAGLSGQAGAGVIWLPVCYSMGMRAGMRGRYVLPRQLLLPCPAVPALLKGLWRE